MKCIYLGAYKAYHPNYDVTYQDINGKRDLPGDMCDIDLLPYDVIICTPPCNYWSRANWRRDTSVYAQKTKHLLPTMLYKLYKLNKPFIVENVRNDKRFTDMGLYDYPLFVYKVGRHTYWSNVYIPLGDIFQKPKISIVNGKKKYLSSQNLNRERRQGTEEVHQVIERFLDVCKKVYFYVEDY